MIAPIRKPLFELGQIVATPTALAAIEQSGEETADFLTRHAFGDWGSVFDEERERNDNAVRTGRADHLRIPHRKRHQDPSHHFSGRHLRASCCDYDSVAGRT